MLQIKIPAIELYDESKQLFTKTKEYNIQMEHSLVSISKWESKWHKPFFSKKEKTSDESIDYIKCMVITQNIPDEAYDNLSEQNLIDIRNYINDTMTATTFSNNDKGYSRSIITNEVIYSKMISLNIPPEYSKWHINRLLTLIKVCDTYANPPKKMSNKELMRRNSNLNKARRANMHTKG